MHILVIIVWHLWVGRNMGNTYIIYLDVFFLINFLMDLAILWATSKLGHFETSRGRLLLASLWGSTYTLTLFFPQVHWLLTFGIKFAFSLVMVAIAFKFVSWKRFFITTGYFYLVSFTAAGVILGMTYYFEQSPLSYQAVNGIYLGQLPYPWLLTGLAATMVVGRLGGGYLKKSFLSSLSQVPVVIRFGSQLISVKALVDTGNHLKDPLTQHPVMVVEYGVLKEILPETIQEVYESGQESCLDERLWTIQDSWWMRRLRLIPFSSVSNKSGMLLGLRPDLVFIQLEGKLVEVKDVVVAICNKTLSSQGTYRALLHLDMVYGR